MFVKLMRYAGKDKYVKHFFKIDGLIFDLHFHDDGSPLLMVSQSGENFYKEIQLYLDCGYRIIEIEDNL